MWSLRRASEQTDRQTHIAILRISAIYVMTRYSALRCATMRYTARCGISRGRVWRYTNQIIIIIIIIIISEACM